MLAAIGLNRDFLLNPVTWVTLVFIGIAAASAVHADRNFDQTCSDAAQVSFGPTAIDEYFVQPLDNQSYEMCKGRIPARFIDLWPLSDCRPGGWSHWSNGNRANFAQNCRPRSGNSQVF